jgi:hypothetical protein
VSTSPIRFEKADATFKEVIEPIGILNSTLRVILDSRAQKSVKVLELGDHVYRNESITHSLSTGIFFDSKNDYLLAESFFKMVFTEGANQEGSSDSMEGVDVMVAIDDESFPAILKEELALNFWIMEVRDFPLKHEKGNIFGLITLQGWNILPSFQYIRASIEPYDLG